MTHRGLLSLCVVPTFVILRVVSSWAAAPPALKVTVLDERTIVVRGAGFADERLLVSADEDAPHASVACYSDFTLRGGALETAQMSAPFLSYFLS